MNAGKKKLKITMIIGDFGRKGAGRWNGGTRPYLLVQALLGLDFEVELVGFGDSSFATSIDVGNGHFVVANIVEKINFPKFLWQSRKLIPHIHGDIVYAYKLKCTSFGVALLKKRKHGVPIILDIDDWEMSWHGGDDWKYDFTPKAVWEDLNRPKGLRFPDHPVYISRLEKRTAKADAVVTHSKFLSERFGGVYVPNGKDLKLFDDKRFDPNLARKKFGLDDYRVIMFPGAPRTYKGVEDLLEGIEMINDRSIRLVIVGGSPYDNYDQVLKDKWSKWIITIPRTDYRNMPEIIAAAHIIAVPQRDHPAALAQFPLKLTDGMSMGKPILATCVGDIPEVLGKTGYLVPPGSPKDIASAIKLIFQDPELAEKRGQQARMRCIDRYSISAMSDCLKPVFQKLELPS